MPSSSSMARSGRGVPLNVLFFTKLYCIISVNTIRLPIASGLAFLPGGRVLLQLAGIVWLADPSGRETGFEPGRLVEAAGLSAPGPVSGPDTSWAHRPLAEGERVFLDEAGRKAEIGRLEQSMRERNCPPG